MIGRLMTDADDDDDESSEGVPGSGLAENRESWQG